MKFSFWKVDVTPLIEGHSSYLWATQHILELLEMDSYYHVFSSISLCYRENKVSVLLLLQRVLELLTTKAEAM